MRRFASWTVLPALVVSAGAGAYASLRAGLPVLAVLAGGGLFYAGVVVLLERVLPYAPRWSHGDIATDLKHLVVTGGLVESAPALGLAPSSLSLWPLHWPLAAQLLLVLLLVELPNYWVHRLLHGPFWRFHAVHHSAPRLYWMNSWRVHPVEGLAYGAFTVAPLLALGAPPMALTVVWAFSSVFRMLQHSNVDARLGPLNWIFAGPETHRWHHSRDRQESEANYGNVLIVWDVLFGTRRMPARPPPLDVGLAAGAAGYPQTYAAQLVAPFRARR